jgi:hypothetical protein
MFSVAEIIWRRIIPRLSNNDLENFCGPKDTALSSHETSVLTKATRRNIQEDGILHSQSREILKFYIALTCRSP